MAPSSSVSSTASYASFRFELPQGVGNTEDVENYILDGFHPVHLGDAFDGGRYRVVHKLGAGGYSTVWLARDEHDHKWIALKICRASHSPAVAKATDLSRSLLQNSDALAGAAVSLREFTFQGPNGRHLALVLPFLGPSLAELSYHWDSRLTPEFARKLGYKVVQVVASFHSRGLCHGDLTTGNLLLGLQNMDQVDADGIYRIFGRPLTAGLKTQSGEPTGLEAPRYIVGSINFLSAPSTVIKPEVHLADYDQCFAAASPPTAMLKTPLEFLAPEVAAGRPASAASDVWALGCCIFRLRSSDGPFSSPFDVTDPASLVSYIIHILRRDMPLASRDTLWDKYGRPTEDASKGHRLHAYPESSSRSLRTLLYETWDEPAGGSTSPGIRRNVDSCFGGPRYTPFHESWAGMAWNPSAVKVDGWPLGGYGRDWDAILEALPKIPEHEADLLFDLVSKIFVYEPRERPTAAELLAHPWFHLDGPQQ